MKINVPTSWSDVSIRQFIELSKVKYLDFDDMDAQFRILSILTGLDDEVFIDMPMPILKRAIELTAFINDHKTVYPIKYKLKIKGNRFKFDYDATKLLAGEYIDIQNYIKSSTNDNLHNIIACYLKPITMFGTIKKECYKKTADGKYIQTLESRNFTSDLLLDNLTMDRVFAMSGFFLIRYERLMMATKIFLEITHKRTMKKLNTKLVKADLPTVTDGI